MKIWLDDERAAPEGWQHETEPLEVIGLISLQPRDGNIEVISLDYDLGQKLGFDVCGHQVLEWIEYEVAHFGLGRIGHLPRLEVHSSNPVGVTRMQATIHAIKRLAPEGWDD